MSNIILNETITHMRDYNGHWRGEAFITHHTYGEQVHRCLEDAQRWNRAQAEIRPATPTKEQLWQAYGAACEARHVHIHVERCETCWGAVTTAQCPQWRALSADVYRTRDAWCLAE